MYERDFFVSYLCFYVFFVLLGEVYFANFTGIIAKCLIYSFEIAWGSYNGFSKKGLLLFRGLPYKCSTLILDVDIFAHISRL